VKIPRVRRHPEHDEQALLFAWASMVALRAPELHLLHAVPNWAGVKGPREGAMRKREGVKAGVPDVHLPVARGGHYGLWIEMKAGTNRATKEQRRWMEALEREGHAVRLCRSFQEAKTVIEWYLGLPKG
jgi:hypothetical protein